MVAQRGGDAFGTYIISGCCKHRDETVAPVGQGDNAELVGHGVSVGYCGKQPIKAVFVNFLQEGDSCGELSHARAELLENRGSERHLEGYHEALFVLSLKHLHLRSFPLHDQPIVVRLL